MKCGKCVEDMKKLYSEEEDLGNGKKRELDVLQCQNKNCPNYSEISKSPAR